MTESMCMYVLCSTSQGIIWESRGMSPVRTEEIRANHKYLWVARKGRMFEVEREGICDDVSP